MKKLLLTSAAVAGLIAVSAPAKAEGLKLDMTGYTRAYVAYVDQDTTTGTEARDVDILRDSEIAFTGEVTLDNGLTVGAYIEADVDAADAFSIDENYIYMAGSWGRVNVGSEDGAAYLLQVAAPSADSVVDGIRQQVQGVNFGLTDLTNAPSELDYDNDVTNNDEKITYLTPVFSGFQAGLSYTPSVAKTEGVAVVAEDNVAGEYGDAFELAFRWEGQFDEVGVILGAGFVTADLEDDLGTQDDYEAWDAGVDLNFGPFGLGFAYVADDQGEKDSDIETMVVGADYVTGPFKLGASYMNQDQENGAGVDETETDRYTGGVVYTFGPGMTFRGSVSYIETDEGAVSTDSTNLLLGTQIKF
jgi:outer membrane protein OmpU